MSSKLILTIIILSFQGAFAQGKFLLIMGPSGTGKSTIINHLKALDNRFIYVTPLTTRALRDGETDKVHMPLEAMNQLNESGKLLTINNIYGIYYATPKNLIDESLALEKFPVLDWPIEKLAVMESNYGNQLFKVYLQPDNLDELQARLSKDSRDQDGKRYESGVQEINNLATGAYDQLIDLKLINYKNRDTEIAELIYINFLKALKN